MPVCRYPLSFLNRFRLRSDTCDIFLLSFINLITPDQGFCTAYQFIVGKRLCKLVVPSA